MTTQDAHIAEVYMCFLPFQLSQWIPTQDEQLNDLIRHWYAEKQEITNSSYITIELGNPKRYTMEQILLLNQRVQYVLEQHGQTVTVDLQVPARYFDKEALQLIYWSIKMAHPDHQVIGFAADIPQVMLNEEYMFNQFSSLNAVEVEQLLPLSIRQQLNVEVMEYHTHDEVDYVFLLQQPQFAAPLLTAVTESAVKAAVLLVNYYHPCDGTAVARAGILTEYDREQALIFDFLHYGFQYKGLPVILNATNESHISVTGQPLNLLAAADYRTAAPQKELFQSLMNRDKIIKRRKINLKADSYQQMIDYYGRPFSIVSMPVTLPSFAVNHIFKQLLLTAKTK